ncbi:MULTISPECIES: MFS transporter [unclassified Paenibacillus]|uniref:MFS transporter n=1 Tax=unclassified Paenibacillus TaxID=185978 RepID=UPI0009312505|nr:MULTISPECIES: MFS transporter [unclassified Paenibacillus]
MDAIPQRQQVQAGEKLLKVLVFTLILSVMNASMFNVVLPEISKQFQLSASQVSWIITSYMIVYAIGSMTFGKLADKYKLKDLLTIGLIVFALGSIMGLAATQFWMVIAGRVLQAAGASVIPATAMIIPIRYFAPEQRGRALGTTAIGLSLGGALGPIVSGFVTSFASWRLLFALSILALLTLPFYRKYLDDERGQAGRIDFVGGFLLAASVAALLLAITLSAWSLLGAGVLLLVLFIVRIRTAAEPFVQPALFRNRAYVYGLMIAFLATSFSFGIGYTIPQLLAHVNHVTPAVIGFLMFPAAISSALLGRRGGRLADERGNSFLVYTAAWMLMICFLAMSTVAGLSPYWIALFLIFGFVGQTFMQIAMSNTISRTLSREQTGIGMGLFSMLNFIAGASATAVIGKVLDFGGSSVGFNPLVTVQSGVLYSNIFLLLALLLAVVILLYALLFGRRKELVVQKAG